MTNKAQTHGKENGGSHEARDRKFIEDLQKIIDFWDERVKARVLRPGIKAPEADGGFEYEVGETYEMRKGNAASLAMMGFVEICEGKEE